MNRLLYATGEGRLRVHRSLQAVARSGWDVGIADRLISLPAGTTLMHLPGRIPIGRSSAGTTVALEEPGAMAVAAVLPPGYLRTWLPAYEDDGRRAPVLPLYGYAAVASVDGEPQVAAMRTDRWNAWNPQAHDRRQIDAAIRAVATGLVVRTVEASRPAFAAVAEQELNLLTPREVEVLGAISNGLSNKAIARQLGISQHTVKFHVEALLHKLGAGSRAEAVYKGLRQRLIQM